MSKLKTVQQMITYISDAPGFGPADTEENGRALVVLLEKAKSIDHLADILLATFGELRYERDQALALVAEHEAAARDIENAYRFRRPDLIEEAYRTLTGSRLVVTA